MQKLTMLVASLMITLVFAPLSCWSLPIGGATVQDTTSAMQRQQLQQQQEQQEQQQIVITQPEYDVDAHQFALYLSTHLLFDHLDTAFSHISQEISQQFRSRIQVDATSDQQCSPVDVHILKGQLKGAVGSFIEDQLPSVWNEYASGLDKYSLQTYIKEQILAACPAAAAASPPPHPHPPEEANVSSSSSSTVVSYACLTNHSADLFASLDSYLTTHLQNALSNIFEKELPALFETTQSHVATTLTHFNQNILAASNCQLRLAPSSERQDEAWSDILDKIKQLASHSTNQPPSIEPSISQFATLAKIS